MPGDRLARALALSLGAGVQWASPRWMWYLDAVEPGLQDDLRDMHLVAVPVRVRAAVPIRSVADIGVTVGYLHASLFGRIDDDVLLFDGAIGARRWFVEPSLRLYLARRVALEVRGHLLAAPTATVDDVRDLLEELTWRVAFGRTHGDALSDMREVLDGGETAPDRPGDDAVGGTTVYARIACPGPRRTSPHPDFAWGWMLVESPLLTLEDIQSLAVPGDLDPETWGVLDLDPAGGFRIVLADAEVACRQTESGPSCEWPTP